VGGEQDRSLSHGAAGVFHEDEPGHAPLGRQAVGAAHLDRGEQFVPRQEAPPAAGPCPAAIMRQQAMAANGRKIEVRRIRSRSLRPPKI
jgi:hypothetical protein